jgi:hypothetical protein
MERGVPILTGNPQEIVDVAERHRAADWTSPSVYPNADTLTATAAEGITATYPILQPLSSVATHIVEILRNQFGVGVKGQALAHADSE